MRTTKAQLEERIVQYEITIKEMESKPMDVSNELF